MIYCPVREEKVLYIKCLDCDEKELCEELTEKERLRKKNENRMSEIQEY